MKSKVYIEDEKKTWEEVERLERGIYEDGKKDGEKIGIEKGIEKGREGIALNMIKHGMDFESIARLTGLSHSKLEEIARGREDFLGTGKKKPFFFGIKERIE